jgi:hypothetical protein
MGNGALPNVRRVPLYSPGGYVGTVINGRYLETAPCREKRCNGGGSHKHLFDLTTGFMVTEPAVNDDMPVNEPVNIRERA